MPTALVKGLDPNTDSDRTGSRAQIRAQFYWGKLNEIQLVKKKCLAKENSKDYHQNTREEKHHRGSTENTREHKGKI